MLSAEDTLVVVIDIQEKLVAAMNKNLTVLNALKVVSAAKKLDIPVLFTEQYPKGLGFTLEPFKNIMCEDFETVEKTYFNALLEDGMLDKIKSYGKKQIVIFGIEAHICVYQTVSSLVENGFEVYVLKDACASRNKHDFKQGIEAMKDNGVRIYTMEMALFEWLKGTKNPKFKEVQALIK